MQEGGGIMVFMRLNLAHKSLSLPSDQGWWRKKNAASQLRRRIELFIKGQVEWLLLVRVAGA